MNPKQWLLDWFEKHTGVKREEIEERSGENYFRLGYIDSFEFISLISELEDIFHITFDNEQFEDKDFSTIDGMSKIVEGVWNNEQG